MRDRIEFLLNEDPVVLQGISPTTTVLNWLRETARLPGTKEGCAEGDCGACTVVLAEGAICRPVNACLLFLPALDGRRLITVEHLRSADDALHPVQQALVDHHASQCGFCTPGFVMTLFALHQAGGAPDRAAAAEALAGNLCRCTGYRPILDAALALPASSPPPAQPAVAPPAQPAIADSQPLALLAPGQRYFAPTSLDQLAELYAAHPSAVLLAGGTDLGLAVTKRHEVPPLVISLEKVAALRQMRWEGETLRLGAGVTYQAALPALADLHPAVPPLVRRIGAWQVRERGTFGGNLGNASPIGDTAPALLALDATLLLRQGAARRRLPIGGFFTGYRQTALAPGEFIEAIEISRPPPGALLRIFKVAKRFDQDISTVCGAFRLDLAEGVVRAARLAWGGMAATPCRAPAAEAALVGKPFTEASIRAGMAALAEDLHPISDMRGSARYRLTLARNLLFKLWLETAA